MKVPAAVGVPFIIIVSFAHKAFTPGGRPVTEPIPVAPLVAWVIFVRAELTHRTGVEEALLVELTNVTVIFPVAFSIPQPPVKGIK